MSESKMREEFEAAFVEEMVTRCGEGFRSSVQFFFIEKEPDGSYSNPIPHAGWWAWQASRESLAIDLPSDTCIKLNNYTALEIRDFFEQSVKRIGLKVSK